MKFLKAMQEAWKIYKKHIGKLILGSIVYFIYLTAVGIITILPALFLLLLSLENASIVFSSILVIIFFALYGMIHGGYYRFNYEAFRKKPELSTIHRFALKRWKSLVGYSLFVFVVILFFIAMQLYFSQVFFLWTILLIVFVLLICMALPSIVVKESTLLKALKYSFKIVTKNILEVIIFLIVLSIIAIIIALIPIIGTILTFVLAPWYLLSYLMLYTKLKA